MAWYDDLWDYFSNDSSAIDYGGGSDFGNIGYFGINPELDEASNLTSSDWDALKSAGFSTSDLESWGLSDPALLGQVGKFIRTVGESGAQAVKSAFTKPDGSVDWRAIATAGGALLPVLTGGSGSSSRPSGYQGGIPQYTAVREQVPQTYDPNRRPGSGGQRYFTDVQYVPKDGDLAAAQTAAAQQAQGLASLNAANPLNAAPPAYQPPPQQTQAAPAQPAYNESYSGANVLNTVREMLNAPRMAKGGIVGLQDGGFVVPADVVSHLGNGSTDAGLAHLTRKGAVPIRGRGDGMSDSNRTTINGRQPAAVADGEAYLPPRQVQNMGGAEKLYAMMDKIRKDRTGTTKQGKQINPNQYV